MSFKVSATEARRIRSLAQHEKLSLSEYLRRRASGRTNNRVKPERIRCPLTGALVFAPLAEHPPLTTETVKLLMSDFP